MRITLNSVAQVAVLLAFAGACNNPLAPDPDPTTKINDAFHPGFPAPRLPKYLAKVEGDAQSAEISTTLSTSVKIKVIDNFGDGYAGVVITFTPTSGSGTVSSTTVTTGADGTASTTWTLGATVGTQTLDVSTSTSLTGTPATLSFTATGTSSGANAANSTITGTSNITANGVATSTVTITLKNAANAGVSGVTPTFTATDTGATNAYGACSVSDAGGVSTCTMTSTKAETKTLSIATPVVKADGTVTFVAGAASKLGFSTEPSTTGNTDSNLTQQPVVQVQDANGNVITTDNATSITIAAYSDACTTAVGGGVSATALSVTASSGVSTYANVKVLKTNVVRLGASGGGYTAACSNAMVISPGAASSIAYTTQPSTTGDTDTALAQQPVVKIYDANSNIITTDSASQITITGHSNNTCTSAVASSISATANPVTVTAGVATFASLKILKTNVIRILASDGTRTICSNADITVSPGAASSIAFTTQPSTTGDTDTALAQQPVVKIYDANSNIITTDSATNITITGHSNNTCTSAVASSITATNNPKTMASGVATFAALKILKTNVIRLLASDGTRTACSSADITVSPGAATKLVFSTEPNTTTDADTNLTSQPVIEIQDANSNRVTTDSTTAVTLKAYSDLCSTEVAASLNVTTNPVTASTGRSTFAGVRIKKIQVIRLGATAGGLTSACSSGSPNGISVTPGASTANSTISASPTSLAADNSTTSTVTITLKDANSNVVSGASATFSATGSGNTLVQPAANTDTAGQTTGTIKSSTAETKTLSIASPAGATGATTTDVTFTSGTTSATNSTVSVSPSSVLANGVATSTITVTIKNSSGSVIAGKAVTLTSSRGATDTITTSPTNTNASGVATFTVVSSTTGASTFTASAAGDSVTVSQTGSVTFLPVATTADWQAYQPTGVVWNSGASVSATWDDVSNSATTYDGTLTNYTNTAAYTQGGIIYRSDAVAFWRFTETTGTTADDLISTNDATHVNSPTLGATVAMTNEYDKAITYAAGSTQYSKVTDAAAVDLGTGNWTISFWFKSTADVAPGNAALIAKTNGGAGGAGYQIFLLSGTSKINVYLVDTDADTVTLNSTNNFYNDNTWHHLAVFRDGTNFKLYVDGALEASATSTVMGNLSGTYDLFFGGQPTGASPSTPTASQYFTGSLDEIAIFSKALSTTEISAIYAARNSSWAGSTAAKSPAALIFDGTNDNVSFGTGLNTDTSVTFEGWFRPTTSGGAGKVIWSNGAIANEGAAGEANTGMTLKQSKSGNGQVQFGLGKSSYFDEVMADSPIVYYRLNETSGTHAYDSSGNNHHAFYSSTNKPDLGLPRDGTWADNDAAIRMIRVNSGGAAGAQRVTLTDRTALDFSTSDFTLEAWIKSTTNTGQHQAIVSKMEGGDTVAGYQMFLLTNGTYQFSTQDVGGTGCHTISAGTTYYADNTWHHVAFVRDGATNRMYIDGVADDTTACGAAQDVSGVEDFFIGSQPERNDGSPSDVWQETTGFNSGFQGLMDEVAIYGSALSATRLAIHYYAGTKRLSCQSKYPIVAGIWNHFAGTFSSAGPTLTFMLNGTQQCSVTLAGAAYTGSGNNLVMGQDTAGANQWSGYAGEARYFASALSLANVKATMTAVSARFPDYPLAAATPALWLKADVLSQSDGTAVSSWTDSSGNARHATQGTGGLQPTFKTSIINSKPVIRFDGGDYLDVGTGMGKTDTYTAFFVLKTSDISGAVQVPFGAADAACDNNQVWLEVVNKWGAGSGIDGVLSTHNSNGAAAASAETTYAPAASGVFFLLTMRRSAGTYGSEIWANGSKIPTSNPTTGTTAGSGGTTYSWGIGRLGACVAGYWTGDFAEAIVYTSTVLSDAERTRIEGYLNAKYALY